MSTAGRIAGVVLAAGASARLGTAKQLLRHPPSEALGETLVARAARLLLEAGCSPVLVVVGAGREEVAAAVAAHNVEVLFNESWKTGMGTSVGCAINRLADANHREPVAAALIVACDMPSITSDHLRALIDCSGNGRRRVASAYSGDRGAEVLGIPALLPRADWTALQRLSGDRGARDLLLLPDTLSVFLRYGIFDLDTPADVERWRGSPPPMSR